MPLEPKELVIAGDFNIYVDIASDPLSMKYSDCLASLGLQQHVHKPTHRANHTLDIVILQNDSSMVSDPRVGDLAISDHSPILFNISLVKPPLIKKRSSLSGRLSPSIRKSSCLTSTTP